MWGAGGVERNSISNVFIVMLYKILCDINYFCIILNGQDHHSYLIFITRNSRKAELMHENCKERKREWDSTWTPEQVIILIMQCSENIDISYRRQVYSIWIYQCPFNQKWTHSYETDVSLFVTVNTVNTSLINLSITQSYITLYDHTLYDYMCKWFLFWVFMSVHDLFLSWESTLCLNIIELILVQTSNQIRASVYQIYFII